MLFYFANKGGEMMATIRTAIQINDMMSQQFRAMNMAMSTVIDSFNTLQDATGKAVDVSALNAAQRELQQVEANFNRIEHEIKQAENAQEKLNRDIGHADSLASNLLGTLGAIAGTYLTLQGIGNAINLSDEMTNINARLNLVLEEKPLLPELEANVKLNFPSDEMTKIEQLQEMIFDSAKRSYAPYLETADLVGKLSMNASDAFKNVAETVAFAELLNKSFSNAGTNAEGIASATLQLTQALGAGALRGEELNAVLEAAPGIVQNIEKYLNISRAELREMASDGEITAEIVKQSMFAAADDINKKFESMPVTWSQIWTNFKNDALKAFQPVLQEINTLANSQKVQEFVANVSQSMYVLSNIILYTLQLIGSIAGFVYDNWSIIGPVVLGAGGAILTFVTALMLAKTWTVLVTAATWAWNAALAANPIVWVLALLVALVGLFYLLIAVVNHFAGTNVSATGIIIAAYMFMYSTFYNIIVFMLNLVLMFAEFWVNVWTNPVYTIKKLFANLANTALDMATSMIGSFDSAATNLANMFIDAANMAISAINWVIDALNQVPGIDIGKVGEISHRTSLVADYSGLKNKINDWVGEAPENYWEAPKLDYTSPFDNAMKGYNWGANLFGGFEFDSNQQMMNFDDLINSIGGLQDAIDAGNMDGKDTAGNTKKLADSVDMAKDDLAYLRDIAERESINRYTTAEIKVDMKNENHIHHDTDIDGIVDRFGEKVEEVISVLAEGDGDDV